MSYKTRWVAKNERKRRAQIAVGNAIRSGKLDRQPCERCGSKRAHAHHEDYSKPLEVKWLCATHHSARHRELREMGIRL
ncbi:MAG: hypothetical protein AB7W44_19625 [Pyrinomonadaceae bacterium]